ncbi:MGMT family protein [Sulfurifustis variabilis]|nr:MGMT family protein [Sulfurifustis variabilis]
MVNVKAASLDVTTGSPSKHARILAVVRRIPRGRVATYGQIAGLAGLPGHARLVGYALHSLPEGSTTPWHRVINARGCISPRSDGSGHDRLQRVLLERESVRFSDEGVVSLKCFQWRPKTRSIF